MPLPGPRTPGERAEMERLGLLDEEGRPRPLPLPDAPRPGPRAVARRAVRNPAVLNEAYDYRPVPSSFSKAVTSALTVHAGQSTCQPRVKAETFSACVARPSRDRRATVARRKKERKKEKKTGEA